MIGPFEETRSGNLRSTLFLPVGPVLSPPHGHRRPSSNDFRGIGSVALRLRNTGTAFSCARNNRQRSIFEEVSERILSPHTPYTSLPPPSLLLLSFPTTTHPPTHTHAHTHRHKSPPHPHTPTHTAASLCLFNKWFLEWVFPLLRANMGGRTPHCFLKRMLFPLFAACVCHQSRTRYPDPVFSHSWLVHLIALSDCEPTQGTDETICTAHESCRSDCRILTKYTTSSAWGTLDPLWCKLSVSFEV